MASSFGAKTTRGEGQRTMLGRAVCVPMMSLALCVTSSAGPGENSQQGKMLYSSQCEQCHKLPQNVTTFHGGVDLETFLGEQHYATTESATAIATYLRVVEKLPLPRRRPPQVQQSASRTLTEAPQQTSANTPLERALNTLLGRSPPDNSTIALSGRRERDERDFKQNRFRNVKKKNNNHNSTPLSVSADRLHTHCHSRVCTRPRPWPRISVNALSLRTFQSILTFANDQLVSWRAA